MERSKAAFLERCVGLERVPAETLHRLSLYTVSKELARREVLWRDGSSVDGLCWVRSGVLRESLHGGATELVLGFRGRGEMVGEIGAMEAVDRPDARQSGTIIAQESSVVYVLKIADLTRLLQHDPLLGIGMASACAERARRSEERLARWLTRTVRQRVAACLLELADEFGVRDSRGIIIDLKLTHRDLAAMIGASRETASVIVGSWRKDGLLATEGKRVVLLDITRVTAQAHGDESEAEHALNG